MRRARPPYKGGQQPRSRRGARALPQDIRATLGEFNTPAEASLAQVGAIALDADVERLTGELCDAAVAEFGTKPVPPEDLQHVFRDWRHAKRAAGVDNAALELAAKRAKARLFIGEALPA